MNRRLCITVRGKSGAEYAFTFDGDPEYLDHWRAEGFEVDEVLNSIPLWVVSLGIVKPWCRLQDAWQWLRIW